jgi:HEAT repeat protein
VTPPSAGFIVQLFVIPALIVMGVVSVWALFGKLADSGSDWQQLVAELGGGNEHRRWRAAQELAQVLHNERLAPPQDNQPLAANPEVARALAALLRESIASPSTAPETIMQQEFVARALGGLDADDITLPVLAECLNPSRPPEVRQSALMAVAIISGRHFEKAVGFAAETETDTPPPPRTPPQKPTIEHPEILSQLRVAAQDQEAVVRHFAAFALGNVGGPDSLRQLRSMLGDSDRQTRANAALGLARNADTAGLPVILELMTGLTQAPAETTAQNEASDAEVLAAANLRAEQPVLARGCLRAARDLWMQLSADEQQQIQAAVQKLADSSLLMADIRVQARSFLSAVQTPTAPK